MSYEDQTVKNLILNILSQEQYDELTPEQYQLYLTPDNTINEIAQAISEHNLSTLSHQDIRNLINAEIQNRITAISDEATSRNNADTGLQNQITTISNTINTYGDVVTHYVDEFATAEQGALANTAIQPNDNISELNNDAGYITNSALEGYATEEYVDSHHDTTKQDVISDLQDIREGAELGSTSLQPEDIIDNTTSSATNKVLSANAGKSLQDQLNNLLGRGKYLSIWDCTTGLAMDTPPVDPYTYENGSYFIVGRVGTTNYRPVGSTYSASTPSTVIETEPVKVNDTYYYESTSNTWRLLDTPVTDVAFSTLAGSPYDNTNLANALNDKQPNLSSVNAGTGISITGSGANVVISNTQTSAEWGNITGDITDQSDLQNVLDEKVTKNNAITGGTYTKITYDSKGLVTSGQNLVASDIPDISSIYATQTDLEDGLATKQDLIDEYTAQEVQALWESN